MANLELWGFGAGPSSKVSGSGINEGGGDAKRKVQSIRKHYCAMRKRLCKQVFDSLDMAMHDEMCIEKNGVRYDDCPVKNIMEGSHEVGKKIVESRKTDNGVSLVQGNLNKNMNQLLVNGLVDYQNYSGLGEVGPSHSLTEVPLWKTIEDVSVPAMPVQISLENKNHSAEVKTRLSHGLEGKCANDVLNASTGMLGEERLSDSLLNLTNEEELLFMDIDGKDVMDKPCYDNVDSLLLSSPCEIQGNDASDICESQKLNTETKFAMPSSSSAAAGLEVVANPLDSSHSDPHPISDHGNDVQSSSVARTPHTEPSEEFVCCILNTEDPDIPSNDVIDLSIVGPHLMTLKSKPIVKEVGYSSINNQRKNEPDGSLKKEDIPSNSLAASQVVRQGLAANTKSSHPPVGVVVKIENPEGNLISAVSRQSNNVNINPSHSKLVHATMMPASDGHLKQEEIDPLTSAKVYAHPNVEEHKDFPETETNSKSYDHEGNDDDNDNDDDNYDNDIPYFSDAETMILEMDLCPTDQDTNATRGVSMYQHEETKRTIVRLEQCARSFMQRAIASQGALAVLYGRKMKQYIKKSEVIIGRATDDVQVDIDLAREGRANKISRRQALIKMEANGSFIIKNLGKSSIFLNGKEVATGQLRGLSTSSLIEIKGVSFIFEINNKSVRKFLEIVDKRREDKRKIFIA